MYETYNYLINRIKDSKNSKCYENYKNTHMFFTNYTSFCSECLEDLNINEQIPPEFDRSMSEEKTTNIVVQINEKKSNFKC